MPSTRADKLAYFVALGLFVCVALVLIDLGIKNDLIKQARALQEAINEARRSVPTDNSGGGSVRSRVLGDIQAFDGTVAGGNVSAEDSGDNVESPRKANRRAGNSNTAVPDRDQ